MVPKPKPEMVLTGMTLTLLGVASTMVEAQCVPWPLKSYGNGLKATKSAGFTMRPLKAGSSSEIPVSRMATLTSGLFFLLLSFSWTLSMPMFWMPQDR